jgi:hypothetical protein
MTTTNFLHLLQSYLGWLKIFTCYVTTYKHIEIKNTDLVTLKSIFYNYVYVICIQSCNQGL